LGYENGKWCSIPYKCENEDDKSNDKTISKTKIKTKTKSKTKSKITTTIANTSEIEISKTEAIKTKSINIEATETQTKTENQTEIETETETETESLIPTPSISTGSFKIFSKDDKSNISFYCEENEFSGVKKIADMVRNDVKLVTGALPEYNYSVNTTIADETAVIFGYYWKNKFIRWN